MARVRICVEGHETEEEMEEGSMHLEEEEEAPSESRLAWEHQLPCLAENPIDEKRRRGEYVD
jgi:hypothetical protein